MQGRLRGSRLRCRRRGGGFQDNDLIATDIFVATRGAALPMMVRCGRCIREKIVIEGVSKAMVSEL